MRAWSEASMEIDEFCRRSAPVVEVDGRAGRSVKLERRRGS
ncbi:MAG: hypothetical protein R3A52_30495 [Polyangiales bacterium]